MWDGITPQDDGFSARLLNKPKPDKQPKESIAPLTELLGHFYRTIGWNVSTGNFTDAVLYMFVIEPQVKRD